MLLLLSTCCSELKSQRLDLLERELSQSDAVTGPNLSFYQVSWLHRVVCMLVFVANQGEPPLTTLGTWYKHFASNSMIIRMYVHNRFTLFNWRPKAPSL